MELSDTVFNTGPQFTREDLKQFAVKYVFTNKMILKAIVNQSGSKEHKHI